MDKRVIWVGMIVGSTLGGFVPSLWDGSMMSFSGLAFSTLGGILGIVLAYKLAA